MKTTNLIQVIKNGNGEFSYTLSEAGENCHFLRFLINSSRFDAGLSASEDIKATNAHHLMSKLCAVGYLFTTNKVDKRAVVAMDFNENLGQSGKSLLGFFCKINVQIHIISYLGLLL